MMLVGAFVVAPRVLAGGGFAGQGELVEALRVAFVGYWRTGGGELSPELASVSDYWFRYHVAKGVIAAILLGVLVVLGALVWRAHLRADALGAGKRAALASGGVVVTGLAVFALVVVMANIQGAVAPYSSLLPMLTDGATDAEVTGTLDQVRQGLAASAAGGETTPALEVMISDFARYHAVMAVIAGVAAAGLIAFSVVLWKAFAGRAGRARRLLGSFGVLSVLLALVMVVVAVANATTAADPEPALAAFFAGGW
ncbi:hypothetical protein [Spirillospora sp. CA-294931]|uniref:hypothetical protein n=1 Tax=Spirillospora sp. CA-294931 TaxID=3240042 RepID=UPI003D8C54DC